MLKFSNAKINLGLYITSKRDDGFHNLESIFYPVQWNDAIEIELNNASKNKIELIEYTNATKIPAEQNLCVKAYNLLDAKFNLPSIKLHLYKTIPMGAGLGGGSSNASTTIKLLNTFFNLNISNQELKSYAAQLGSDCPFFIDNKPTYVTGRGEITKPIELDLSQYTILLINPNIHISTAQAFSSIIPKEINFNLAEKIISSKPNEWKTFLVNDFENSAIEKYPIIGQIKKQMYELGAVYSSMSGSGSTVYSIFENFLDAEKIRNQFPNLKSKIIYSKNYFAEFL